MPLPQLKVHVKGSASVFREAERGVLYISISCTGNDKESTSSTVSSATERLISVFRQYATKTEDELHPHPSAAITTFTVSAPTANSFVVNAREITGRLIPDAPREHTIITNAQVVFRDLNLLAQLSTELTAMRNVSIERTEWRLTEATKAEIKREARVKAINDAVEKARDYASAVGREVVAVSIEDGPSSFSNVPLLNPLAAAHLGPMERARLAALLQQQQQQQRMPMPMPMQQQQQQMPAVSPEGPSLEPSTITVDASVDVSFVSVDGEEVHMSD